jgi:hypothetical protein
MRYEDGSRITEPFACCIAWKLDVDHPCSQTVAIGPLKAWQQRRKLFHVNH